MSEADQTEHTPSADAGNAGNAGEQPTSVTAATADGQSTPGEQPPISSETIAGDAEPTEEGGSSNTSAARGATDAPTQSAAPTSTTTTDTNDSSNGPKNMEWNASVLADNATAASSPTSNGGASNAAPPAATSTTTADDANTPTDAGTQKDEEVEPTAAQKAFPVGPAATSGDAVLSEAMRTFRDKVERDPWDLHAWQQLMRDAWQRPVDSVRTIYEACVKQFPTSALYWRQYVEHEIQAEHYEAVRELLKKCVLVVRDLALWLTYIKFQKLTNNVEQPDGVQAIERAYEFAIEHMGDDIDSAPLWLDYATFVRERPAAEEGLRLNAVRHIYQRGVCMPVRAVEQIWRAYHQYETKVSGQHALSLMQKFAPQYAHAQECYRRLNVYWRELNRIALAVPPEASLECRQTVDAWRRLIEFEKTNPTRLDNDKMEARVARAYETALLQLYRHAPMWLEFATYVQEHGGMARCEEVLRRAVEAVPHEPLLSFALADLLESDKRVDEAKAVYAALHETAAHPLGFIQHMRFALRAGGGVVEARKVFSAARKSSVCTWHVYAFSAMMEVRHNNDTKVARKIYELALKKFPQEPLFVLDYINFLERVSPPSDVRALFERSLATLNVSSALCVWNRFVEFERDHGTLASLQAVEARRQTYYSAMNVGSLPVALERYAYGPLQACSGTTLCAYAHLSHTQPESVLRETQPQASLMGGARMGGGSRRAQNRQAEIDEIAARRAREKEYAALEERLRSEMPLPDLNKWTRFVDAPGRGVGSASYPTWLNSLLGILPPPHKYDGPIVNSDIVMAVTMSHADKVPPTLTDAVATISASDDPFASGAILHVNRRKRTRGGASSLEPAAKAMRAGSATAASAVAPATDIYRARHKASRQ